MLDRFLQRWRSSTPSEAHSYPDDDTGPADPSSLSWRKGLLIVSAMLVGIYLLSVVVHSQQVPDIGLFCLLSTSVSGVSQEQIVSASEPGNYRGYAVQEIGPFPIHTWPDLVRALRDLGDDAPTVNDPATSPPGLTHRVYEGQEQVLVKLRPTPESAGLVELWCRVDRSQVDHLLPSMLWFLLKGGLFFVALLVYWKRPHDRSAAQFFLLSFVTVGAYLGGYHWWRIVPWPALILVFMVSAVLLPAVNLHFYLLFPRPKQALRRHPLATLGVTYGVPLVFLALMIGYYFHTRMLVNSGAPAAAVIPAVNEALRGLGSVILVYLPLAAIWYVASIGCLIHSFGTAGDATERNQVKCILFGSLLALAPIGWSLYLVLCDQDGFGKGQASWPMFAASACITAAYVVSITRYRLMQLDQLVSSGVVYFLISFLAGLIYCGVMFVAMLVVPRGFGGPSLGNALAVSATALMLVVGLELARGRLHKVLDRRFRKEKHNLDRTLQQMGQAVEQLVDPPTLARRLLQASAELLGVARGSVYLRQGQPPLYRLAQCQGPPPPLLELAPGCPLIDALQQRPMLALRPANTAGTNADLGQLRLLGGEVAQALTHEGELLALLVLGAKESGPYTPEDFNLLAALAQITALALENAERHHTIETLNRDLQAKVEKISEQQRRIIALQSQLVKADTGTPRNGDAETEDAARNGAAPAPRGGASQDGIIGSSPTVRQLLQLVRRVAQSPSAVLLRGESGTGKELLAQALHEHSSRAGKAFVKVHCASLSPGLLESELFGHVKGAFTGAHRDKVGRFELANGGTLFLDEIGDISLDVQTKLLRVLQETTFERVGSSEPLHVDVRIIAATHQDLEELIRQGRFRKDLFYRLNVIAITVPALRERREDIAELALHFLRVYAQRAGRPVAHLDDDVLAALKAYAWPGNIRQLENVIERAVVVAEGPVITLNDLPPEVLAPAGDTNGTAHKEAPSSTAIMAAVSGRSRREERDEREKEELVRALAAADGNKAEAARALGLARSTLLSKLKKFGLS